MIYESISPARLAAIESRAQSELGIAINGTEGTATKNGITISWVYDPDDQTLTVGDTRKPWCAAAIARAWIGLLQIDAPPAPPAA